MILKKGSKGKEVGNWQRFLNEYFNYLTTSPLVVDNDFGEKTKQLTKRYQQHYDLVEDGIVGFKTEFQAIKDGYKPMEKETITRPINEIIVHITANGNGLTGEALRKHIEAGHIARNFDEIGYHWIVDKNGLVIKGRNEAKIGAHVAGHNTNTIGIAYDARGKDNDPNGKYGKHFQSDAQREAFERLIQEKMQEFNITKVTGHNKYDAGKACPCFDSDSKEFKTAIGL